MLHLTPEVLTDTLYFFLSLNYGIYIYFSKFRLCLEYRSTSNSRDNHPLQDGKPVPYHETTASASISTLILVSTNLAPTIIVAAGSISPNTSFSALPTSAQSSSLVTNIRTRTTSDFLPPSLSIAFTISEKIWSVWSYADVGWSTIPEAGSMEVVPETKINGPFFTALA